MRKKKIGDIGERERKTKKRTALVAMSATHVLLEGENHV
jgi:hypothetical protein